jgi:hypothetical protein
MTDLKRLGKRNSYRLGRLRSQGIAQAAPPALLRPSFTRSYHRGPASLWLLAAIGGAALIWGAAELGIWYAPFVIGVAAGLADGYGGWRARVTVTAVVLMALAGWGVPLILMSVHGEPSGATVRVIGALVGLPAYAAAGVSLTLLIAAVQAVVGLWLGRALTPQRN